MRVVWSRSEFSTPSKIKISVSWFVTEQDFSAAKKAEKSLGTLLITH